MEGLIKKIIFLFLTPECFDEYFVNFNFFHVPCLKATISKALGLVIIAGSVMVKVPQITKILNAKSAEGISFASVLLELSAITSSASYSFTRGFPFSAWGEGLFLALQTAAIAALVLHFGRSAAHGAAFAALYSVFVYSLTSGIVPPDFLWNLQALNVPIIVTGKMLQVIANYRNGGTGQLSFATGCMLFFGSLARIFTSIQETGDIILVVTYMSAFSVNAMIFGQLIYYNRKSPKSSPAKSKKGSTKEQRSSGKQRAKKE
ncbi:mannose-P-dolichol utilization defect 1 protein homolog isoform X2 [Schistocerca nitens]|nr:mannose-P-dolichol utilization defect 1 protein homolog isoform X2 [Schistocerca nitens]